MEFNIALLRGDGIGPEIVDAQLKYLIRRLKNSVIHLILLRILSAVLQLTLQASLCLKKLLKAVLPATAYCWEQ